MAGDGVIISALANGEVTNLVHGEIVRQSAVVKNTALRAIATSAAGVQGTLGVILSGDVGPGGPVITETAGRQPVLLEGGLAPAVGQWVFVSATVAGRGTNVQPTIAVPVGTILDTSTYSRDSRVLVSMPVVLLPASPTQTGLLLPDGFNKLAALSIDWFDYVKGIFADKTGLNELQYVGGSHEDFEDYTGGWINDVAVSGAGATAGISTTGSIVKLDGPDVGVAGFSEYHPGAAAGVLLNPITSTTMKRWMIAVRMSKTASIFTALRVIAGLSINNKTQLIGMGRVGDGSANDAFWSHVRDTTNVLQTATRFEEGTAFSLFYSFYFANFNFRDLVCNMHPGVDADTVVASVPTMLEGPARPYVGILATAASLTRGDLWLDKVYMVREI